MIVSTHNRISTRIFLHSIFTFYRQFCSIRLLFLTIFCIQTAKKMKLISTLSRRVFGRQSDLFIKCTLSNIPLWWWRRRRSSSSSLEDLSKRRKGLEQLESVFCGDQSIKMESADILMGGGWHLKIWNLLTKVERLSILTWFRLFVLFFTFKLANCVVCILDQYLESILVRFWYLNAEAIHFSFPCKSRYGYYDVLYDNRIFETNRLSHTTCEHVKERFGKSLPNIRWNKKVYLFAIYKFGFFLSNQSIIKQSISYLNPRSLDSNLVLKFNERTFNTRHIRIWSIWL